VATCGRLARSVAKVSLWSAIVPIHADEYMHEEVEEGVCFQFLPNEAARAVGVGVPQVELSQHPRGIVLQCHRTPHDDMLYATWDSIRELVRIQYDLCDALSLHSEEGAYRESCEHRSYRNRSESRVGE